MMDVDFKLLSPEDFATKGPDTFATAVMVLGAVFVGFVIGFVTRWIAHG